MIGIQPSSAQIGRLRADSIQATVTSS